MKKKLDKVTRSMVRKAVLYLLDKYNIPYEIPVTAQNAVQIASQLYAEGILTAEMLVEVNLSLEMISELTLDSTLDTQANLILNTVTGSTAAYSLRQINANYTGPLIRVRRSDNQELDITGGPTGINETQLTNFVGSGNAFVTIIYDQSGTNHLTQTVAANQPQIVINGAINKVNDKPAILFDGVNDWFKRNFTIGTVLTRFVVISHLSPQDDSGIVLDDGATPDRAYLTMSAPTTLRLYSGVNFTYTGVANNTQFATYNLFNSTSSQISVNNRPVSTGTTSTGATTYNGVALGTRGGSTPGYYGSFHFQELIMYNSNKSADKDTVMNNINQHYQIYWDGNQQRLLDQYPNAAAAYSLRNLNAAYLEPLVRVRRATDNVELDVYGKYDGTLDTQSLTSFGASTDCFVRRWYDQSGNARHGVQTTTTRQVRIVESGAIYYNEGSVALFPSQIGANYVVSWTETINPTIFMIIKRPAARYWSLTFPTGGASFLSIGQSGSVNAMNAITATNVFINSASSAITNRTELWNATSNKTLVTQYWSSANYTSMTRIGSTENDYDMPIFYELIIYNSNQLSNRTGIESNINSFYQIY